MARAEILIVEDERIVAEDIRIDLESLGYAVTDIVASGKAAIEAAQKARPDLVLMDIVIKGAMNGIETAQQLLDRLDIPVVYLTAYAEDETLKRAMATRPYGYIVKPFEKRELATTLEIALYKHQMQKKLRESEERYRIVVENSLDGVAIVQGDNLVFVNQTFVDIFGFERPEDICGQPIARVVHADDRDRVAAYNRNRQQGREAPARYEFKGIRKDGETVFIEVSAIETTYLGESVSLASLRDATRRKKLESLLRQAQKMEAIGTLAGGIAHDFNNILGVIIGCTELALAEMPKNTKLYQHLKQVLSAGYRAAELVQQILTFSRQRELELRPMPVAPIFNEVIKMLRASLPATIQIEPSIDQQAGMALVDPAQIYQVIMNLSTNAAHAMREHGGTLHLGLDRVAYETGGNDLPDDLNYGTYLRLSVVDTGHGMDRETMGRIFDPYFTTKPPGEGTGLGLAVVIGIVKNFGGSVSVESAPGRGTRFEAYLPRLDSTEALEQPQRLADEYPRGTERILFVDDEEILGKTAQRMLQYLGYQVHLETDSIAALQRFREQPERFDLVITDMTMPNMTGDHLAKEILQLRADMPVILCTGFSHRITAEHVKAMGIREFLKKPLLIDEIAKIVRRVLDGPAEGSPAR